MRVPYLVTSTNYFAQVYIDSGLVGLVGTGSTSDFQWSIVKPVLKKDPIDRKELKKIQTLNFYATIMKRDT